MWEFYNGPLPLNYDIHHINKNKTDNRIQNLDVMPKNEHARRFATGNNQFNKKRKR